MHRTSKLSFLLLVLFVAAACTEESSGPNYQPISRQTATAQANLYIDTHTKGVAASALFLDGSKLAHEGVNSIDSSSSGGSTICSTDINGNMVCEDTVDATTSLDMTADADSTVKWFADHVFNDARVTLEEETLIVYTLDPSLFCGSESQSPTPIDPITGEPIGEPIPSSVDSECVATFTAHPVKVELRSLPSDVLQATVVIDGARPLSVTLAEASVAVEFDLAGAKKAMDVLSEGRTDSEFSMLSGLTTVQGKVKVQVERLGEKHYEASTQITQAINIAGTLEGQPFSFKLGTSTASIEVDGIARVLTTAAKIGALDLEMPFGFESDSVDGGGSSSAPPTVVNLHLGGASASATFTADNDALTVSNISLGDTTSTVKVNGQTIVSLDLNPDMGRAFDLTLQSLAESGVTAIVSPGLHLKVLLALQNAASLFGGEEIPAWGRNETLELRLDGAPKPSVQFSDSGLQVVEGTLTFSATSLPSPVVIEAGMCVGGFDSQDSPTTPIDPNTGEPISDPIDTTEPDQHPFVSVEAVTCGGASPTPMP